MCYRAGHKKKNNTFRGWNSYFTQCWNPLPLIFIEVNTKQFPTKWAEYPTPLLVLKLKCYINKHIKSFALILLKKKNNKTIGFQNIFYFILFWWLEIPNYRYYYIRIGICYTQRTSSLNEVGKNLVIWRYWWPSACARSKEVKEIVP